MADHSFVHAGSETLHLSVLRSDDQRREGFGEVISVTLVSNTDDVTPAALVASLTGGITIVDNVDMKKDPQQPSVQVYPNPVSDRLHLKGLSPMEPYRILDLRGKVWTSGNVDPYGDTCITVSQLPAGFYFLKTESGTTKRVQVR